MRATKRFAVATERAQRFLREPGRSRCFAAAIVRFGTPHRDREARLRPAFLRQRRHESLGGVQQLQSAREFLAARSLRGLREYDREVLRREAGGAEPEDG